MSSLATSYWLVCSGLVPGPLVFQFLCSHPPPLAYFHHQASLGASPLKRLPPSVHCSPKRRSPPFLLWWNSLPTCSWILTAFYWPVCPGLVPGPPVLQFLGSQPPPLAYFHHQAPLCASQVSVAMLISFFFHNDLTKFDFI